MFYPIQMLWTFVYSLTMLAMRVLLVTCTFITDVHPVKFVLCINMLKLVRLTDLSVQ